MASANDVAIAHHELNQVEKLDAELQVSRLLSLGYGKVSDFSGVLSALSLFVSSISQRLLVQSDLPSTRARFARFVFGDAPITIAL